MLQIWQGTVSQYIKNALRGSLPARYRKPYMTTKSTLTKEPCQNSKKSTIFSSLLLNNVHIVQWYVLKSMYYNCHHPNPNPAQLKGHPCRRVCREFFSLLSSCLPKQPGTIPTHYRQYLIWFSMYRILSPLNDIGFGIVPSLSYPLPKQPMIIPTHFRL